MPEPHSKIVQQQLDRALLLVSQAKPNDASQLDRKYDVMIRHLKEWVEYYRKNLLKAQEDE